MMYNPPDTAESSEKRNCYAEVQPEELRDGFDPGIPSESRLNDRFEEMTGYDEDETVGRNRRFLQGDDKNSIRTY